MARKGPLITLLAGGMLAAGLLIANLVATGDDRDPVAVGSTPTPAASPTPTESPAAPEEPAEPVTYVGYVDGGGASVAIIITGEEAIAYVCDGVAVEAWLQGSARDGELSLAGEGGRLTGTYDEDGVTGETTASGREWTFALESAAPPEGLYRFAETIIGGAEVDGGWIVLPDGTQIGLLTVDGVPAPAPALDPVTGEVEVAGQTVTAQRQG